MTSCESAGELWVRGWKQNAAVRFSSAILSSLSFSIFVLLLLPILSYIHFFSFVLFGLVSLFCDRFMRAF